MHKIKGVGLPFDFNFSSCSDIKPTNFEWSVKDGNYLLHCDFGLLTEPDLEKYPKEKRFGWTCESSFIIPNVIKLLKENYKLLFDHYYEIIFTHDQSLLDLDSRFIYCPNGSNYPWIRKNDWRIYEKTKICSMFASPKIFTDGHVYRHRVAKMAIDKGFDVFGGAHGTPRTVIDPRNPWNTKIDGVKDYMFNIVVENGVYDSYWTEKLTDCFAVGTVPVYCGTKKILDFFDPDGIIFLELDKEAETLNSLSKELYNLKLPAILNNFNAVNKIKLADEYLFNSIIK